MYIHTYIYKYYVCLQLVSLPIWSSTGIQSAAAGQLGARFPVHRLLYAAQTDLAPILSVPIKSELRVHTHTNKCMCKNCAGVKLEKQLIKTKNHKNKMEYFIDLTDNAVAFYTLPPLKLTKKRYTNLVKIFVTGWRRRGRTHKYIGLINIKSGIDLTILVLISVYLSVWTHKYQLL